MTTLPWRGRCSSWYGALSHLKFVLNKSQVQRSRHQFHYTYMLQYQSRHHGGLSGHSSFQVAFSVLILFLLQCMPPRGWGPREQEEVASPRRPRRPWPQQLSPPPSPLTIPPMRAPLSSVPDGCAKTLNQKRLAFR